ncbi:MAG: HAMP domain-containing protein [Candidatus Thiodiazotropha sp. (ex Lucinoma aequizonata)]|nr:HAMP domain-containing protein [Candidatus Thiodiazotropha sp. (ex Lucinoma aequizonata)]MCU7887330.1 HAMP domain-containing protein [Candidatus Thiodiazotropha sp. (ex Lucinoma aequizonata)]MCU7899527.1 HAMP domain-containing protein [Candidatus Thiodiazotropha sp. (ex Lucinoma aequizonata)]MCU7903347.1 HAMP domain-containing protein [Candidatus Thiodiazotropha sp. (ex Lucinoma aequizonata)]MCU7908513.1 HAMP domain-containing protein [Candidatus Thiodiazotropha sp. (ex Lucinoma aequizonata)
MVIIGMWSWQGLSLAIMFHWMTSRLNRRFLVATAAGLLMSTLIFLMLFLGMYKSEIGRERTEAVTQVNQLLRTSLENAMLKRDLDGLRHIIHGLGQQQNIVNVMITNPAGEIRFADSPTLLGDTLVFNKNNNDATAGFIIDNAGHEVLRSINPVHNKAPCTECHGPINVNPINGILYVDYDAASLRQHAWKTTLVLMGSGAIIVLINITGGWWFIRRYVLKPISTLSDASDALSQGELKTRVTLQGEDELARLGHTINRMAGNLQDKLRELKEKEVFLQSLVDAIPDGVRIIDSNYNVQLVNRSYKEQLGLSDKSALDVCYKYSHNRTEPCPPTLIICPVYEIVQHGKPVKALHHHTRQNGSRMDVEIYAAPMKSYINGKMEQLIVESIRDLEKSVKYSQEQKLSELGRLATGVAHEIYNPLTSVRIALHASLQILAELDMSTDEVSSYLEILDKEVDNCIDVTERLLKLGASQDSSPLLLDIQSVLRDTITLLHWEAENKKIEIIENYQPGLRFLAIDSEMRMVTLNLAQNAFHAMPNGGTLKISTARTDIGIEIVFRDSGVGIKENNLKKIFDPFFSRRADGSHGTGLGLSITHTIIKNHDGKISVNSSEGDGSTFCVLLPDPDKTLGEIK